VLKTAAEKGAGLTLPVLFKCKGAEESFYSYAERRGRLIPVLFPKLHG
jgi:hypothetical protein